MKKAVFLFFLLIDLCFGVKVNASETLSYVPENPQYALIMIHGYGQSGERMKTMSGQLQKILSDTALYFPTAPERGPWGGYQWFSIPKLGAEMSDKALYDKMMKEALENTKPLHSLIDDIHQTYGIEYENISVAGFSQGGLMALLTGLTSKHSLHKVVSFSGVPLLLTDDFGAKNITSTPQILIIQGDRDTVIPINSFQMTMDTLKTLGIGAELQIIRGMAHQIGTGALKEFADFMVFEVE